MKKLLAVFFLLHVVCITGHASIDFTNYNAHIILTKDSSQIVLNNADKVTGWSEFSIVKNFVRTPVHMWAEKYTRSVPIGKSSSQTPGTNLIIANSNAIAYAPVMGGFDNTEKAALIETVRTDRNAFEYCCKNTSNALANGLKNNSNTLTGVLCAGSILAQSTSNAITSCSKNTSNALIYGIKNNSNVIVGIDINTVVDANALVRSTSHAFLYCCENINNAFNSAIKIYDTHKVYSSDTLEQNLVFFKNGFTVNSQKTLSINTSIPVTGNINLNDTGMIHLDSDLYMGSNAYLTNGGDLDGNGYSLVLSCSFSIPENKQLHIVSDTIINGHGTTLYLEPHARIVVDHGVTLTLKNMRIKNTRNSLANPIIRPIGHDACVALQDVELALADDFIFRDGQLFIHDDVLVTGSSKFSYRSSQASYICNSGTLGFDKNTTFFYYPSSSDNYLIHMQSETASMYFDGATLLTTHTGMRLSKGMLYLDNNVTLRSRAETKMGLLTGVASKDQGGVNCQSISWSPDGKYLAVGTNQNPGGGEDDRAREVRVYRFDTAVTPTLVGVASRDQGAVASVYAVSWSPDGKYLAVGTSVGAVPDVPRSLVGLGDALQVYRFDTTATPTLVGVAGKELGVAAVKTLDWRPDGKHLAIGTDIAPLFPDLYVSGLDELRVYSFDGNLLTGVVSKNQGETVHSVSWNPDGKHLAIGIDGGSSAPAHNNIGVGEELRVYRFDTSSTQTLFGVDGKNQGGDHVYDLDWSPDGQYVAIGTGGNPILPVDGSPDGGVYYGHELRVYRFDGSSLSGVASSNTWIMYSLSWSPDGSYIAIGRASNGFLRIYRFDGAALNYLSDFNKPQNIADVQSVFWRPDGKYIAIATNAGPGVPDVEDTGIATGHELRVYEVGYQFDTTGQSYDKGIVFGDSLQTDGDLNVQVLAGAHVKIAGSVLDDSSF